MTLTHVMTYAIPVIASCALKHLMHCTILPLAHIHLFTLGSAEPKSEVQAEQAQVEEFTNLSLDQGKLWCIKSLLLVFYFLNLTLCSIMIVH
jgi:hypothetical protein